MDHYANVSRQKDEFDGGELLMAGATDWGMVSFDFPVHPAIPDEYR